MTIWQPGVGWEKVRHLEGSPPARTVRSYCTSQPCAVAWGPNMSHRFATDCVLVRPLRVASRHQAIAFGDQLEDGLDRQPRLGRAHLDRGTASSPHPPCGAYTSVLAGRRGLISDCQIDNISRFMIF